MKRKTLNLLLGALALGLVGVVVVQQRKDEARLLTPPPSEKNAPLTTLQQSAINHIALRHPGADDILLARGDDGWSLTAPVKAPADTVEVDKLLALAGTDNRSTIDIKGVNRADFGLDPAPVTLELNDTLFALGGIESIKYLRYVEVDAGKPGDHIALITNPDEAVLDTDYTDLLSKKLMPAKADITSIQLPNLRVERKGTVWTAQPADKEATQDDFQSFVDSWARASAFHTEVPEVPKGESKNLMAKVVFADGSARDYLIVNRSPQLILDYAPFRVRYRLPPDVSARMLALPKPTPPPPAAAEAPKADGEPASSAPAEAAPDAGPAPGSR